jgi:polyhydroxyalkanoate synthesis repressor PhaR
VHKSLGAWTFGADGVRSPRNMLVKKYGNRRLYDTEGSRYVTLEELAAKIKAGSDARVIDAKTGEDLTQSTLTQIILESRGAARLLPVPLLVQLIRLGDDALTEFFGRYVVWALDVYLQTKQAALVPFGAFANPLARMLGLGGGGWNEPPLRNVPPGGTAPMTPAPPSANGEPSDVANEVAELRRELEALKKSARRKRRPRAS